MKILLALASLGLMFSPATAEAPEAGDTSYAEPETSLVEEQTSADGEELSPVETEDGQEEVPTLPEDITEDELFDMIAEAVKDIDWTEMLEKVQSTTWWKGLVAFLVAYVTANAGTILILAIKLIRNKVEKTKQIQALRNIQEDNSKENSETREFIRAEMKAFRDEMRKEREATERRESVAKSLASGTSDKVAEDLE